MLYVESVPKKVSHHATNSENALSIMSTFKSIAILSTLPFLTWGAKSHQGLQNFTLYGYSDQFGGNPLIYADGKQPIQTTQLARKGDSSIEGYAYIGNIDELNTTDAAIVRCKYGMQNLK